MRVRIVVVSWNSGSVLPRCLAHLQAADWDGVAPEIIVVDNGSTDGCTTDWSVRNPAIELRQMGENRGFGAAVNAALHDLGALDAVALINPDAFVDSGWLQPLVDTLAADAGVGAACPKILLEGPGVDGVPLINNAGNVLGPTWEFHDRGYGEVDRGQYDAPEEVWGWCGGAVLLRAAYLADVGGFYEELFLYAEDVDHSWRGRKRGWTYHYEPSSVVRHLHRASSGGRRTPLLDYLNRRNRLIVVTRNGGARGAAVAWLRALGGIAAAAVRTGFTSWIRRQPVDAEALRRRLRAATDAARVLANRRPRHPLG